MDDYGADSSARGTHGTDARRSRYHRIPFLTPLISP